MSCERKDFEKVKIDVQEVESKVNLSEGQATTSLSIPSFFSDYSGDAVIERRGEDKTRQDKPLVCSHDEVDREAKR